MAEEYSYPIDVDWTTEEVIDVVQFFEAVEAAFDNGINSRVFKERYDRFKIVVPSKAEEKTIFRDFKQSSGMEAYQAVKQLKDMEEDVTIKV
ncbi:hypothetical protein WN59_09050 [Salinicoccus sediminis]|uniref:Uncharacterized protein n=1 Tax=Salinicoccus sediminis TaxID=1432562 RepID=A0A0M2SGA5_9STAP|nr:UPF0223 family protein [Salinicoccus sediminis]KKK33754.1 hypothetical protein WN59_09050 [Salinicoccus sediminis]